MAGRIAQVIGFACSVVLPVLPSPILLVPLAAHAQTVDDGSDAAIGKEDARTILALVKGHLDPATEPKVTALRRSKGPIICGSVDVKGKDGRYLGERGFIADVSALTFGRVPEGVELLNPRAEGFEEKEQIRQQYFEKCLD